MENKPKIGVVILAAGLGRRMNSTKLKVMHELNGKPFIEYVTQSVEIALPETKPVVIVCNDDPSVQTYLGDRAEYVVQAERLGTGHAVSMAESLLRGKVDHVVTLYGDMPFISATSIQRLVERHCERKNTITLMTVTVPDFTGFHAALYDYGRIIRGENGHIIRSIEKKDATDEQLQIKELNPCYYCFQADWLWDHVKKIQNNNAQKEYYLTDLVHEAIVDHQPLSSIDIPPREAIGINTQEQYDIAQNVFKQTI